MRVKTYLIMIQPIIEGFVNQETCKDRFLYVVQKINWLNSHLVDCFYYHRQMLKCCLENQSAIFTFNRLFISENNLQ